MKRNHSLDVLRGIALGLSAYSVAMHLWGWVLVVPGAYRSYSDLRPFYTGAYMLRIGQGKELYNWEAQEKVQDQVVGIQPPGVNEWPFLSPAFFAALLRPLSQLSFRNAFIVFAVVNYALLVACWLALWPKIPNLRGVYAWLPFALFFGFYPTAAGILEGQNSMFLTAIFLGCLLLLEQERPVVAGAFIALGLFKFPIVLPVVFLFLLWREWRFVLGFSIAGMSLAAWSISLTGWRAQLDYVGLLISVGDLAVKLPGIEQHLYSMPNLQGLMWGIFRNLLPERAVEAMTLLTSLALVVLAARLGRDMTSADRFLLAMPAAILVSYHTYAHDMTILLVPILLLLHRSLPAEVDGVSSDRWIGRMAFLAFVAPMVFYCFFPFHAYLAAFAVGGLLWALDSAAKSHAAHQSYLPLRGSYFVDA